MNPSAVADQDFKSAVRAYWEDPATISIIDANLHELEISTVCRYLSPSDHLADIGCGDGAATIRYAAEVRQVTAIERSDRLRAQAAQAAAQAGLINITLQPGDILEMGHVESQYDVVVTQRMLINLSSWDDQMHALRHIHRMLKPGGRYIMIENTNDAFQALNDMRHQVDLAPVPQHWHNRFFDYHDLMSFMKGRFQLLASHDFGLYYLLTRVFVPMFAHFSGYGANAKKDPIYQYADQAARTLFEKFAGDIKINSCRALGPIQTFVFRKEADPNTADSPCCCQEHKTR